MQDDEQLEYIYSLCPANIPEVEWRDMVLGALDRAANPEDPGITEERLTVFAAFFEVVALLQAGQGVAPISRERFLLEIQSMSSFEATLGYLQSLVYQEDRPALISDVGWALTNISLHLPLAEASRPAQAFSGRTVLFSRAAAMESRQFRPLVGLDLHPDLHFLEGIAAEELETVDMAIHSIVFKP